ncbi:hypothetical protein TB2_037276 [Malus domestica]
MLEACLHLPRPKKKFDPFISLFECGFNISVDQPFPLNQLCHNSWRWSFIISNNCVLRPPLRSRSFLGRLSAGHAIYPLVPAFLGFGQCSVNAFRRMICKPTLIARFGRFESLLAPRWLRTARITFIVVLVVK